MIPVGAGLPANKGKALAMHRDVFVAGKSQRRTAAPTRMPLNKDT